MVDDANVKDYLDKYPGNDFVISSKALKFIEDEKPQKPTMHTFMYELDTVTDGFQGGEVVVISGYTGHGKTTLMKTLIGQLCGRDGVPLVFSYEVQSKQFLNDFPQLPLFYLPKEYTSGLTWIEQKIKEGLNVYDINCVFIDHLHYVINFKNLTGNASLTVGEAMRDIKKLALKYDIPIFVIAHTTKIAEDSVPGLHSLRDSSFVSQEADMVMIIWRRSQKDSDGELTILTEQAKLGVFKNRRTGKLKIIKLKHTDGWLLEQNTEYGLD